ncbi:MAG: hypothetical protein HYU99_02075 [Deltaproteobacteria bacterium]|nr:hypothetical protein [Deltaproteobacteria bacterium]
MDQIELCAATATTPRKNPRHRSGGSLKARRNVLPSPYLFTEVYGVPLHR